jgi:hypothetical protein
MGGDEKRVRIVVDIGRCKVYLMALRAICPPVVIFVQERKVSVFMVS